MHNFKGKTIASKKANFNAVKYLKLLTFEEYPRTQRLHNRSERFF